MQGQVFVPYTGIGGFNMDTGIMPTSVGGSTAPGVGGDEFGSTYNLTWTFPGGINNQSPGGVAWGFALYRQVPCTEDELEKWLKGEVKNARIDPIYTFSDEEIQQASDPRLADTINLLMKKYLADVMDALDITRFRDAYPGCILRG